MTSSSRAARGTGVTGDLDLQAVETFCAVVATGGFSLAAARVSLTQSAVTKHIRKLEDTLGVRLFERAGFSRSVRLTPDGLVFLDVAQRILATEQLLFSELEADLRDPADAPVEIALAVAVLPEALLDVVSTLQLLRPDARWCLEHRELRPSAHGLLPAGAALGALWLPDHEQLPPGLTARVIAEESPVALVPPHARLAHEGALTSADLAVAGYAPVRLPSPEGTGPALPGSDDEARSWMERAIRGVLSNDAVAVVPRSLARLHGAAGVRIDLLDAAPFRLGVVRRDDCPAELAAVVDRAVDLTTRS